MKTLPLLLLLSSPALWAAPSYRLHEWGTFTSVSGSDGVLLDGVENDVEPLPWFVHSHEPRAPGNMPLVYPVGVVSAFGGISKGLGTRPLQGVTVKMETPVIYLYSDEKFDAEVSVGFKGGSISQWYPDRSCGETVPFRGVDPKTKKFEQGAMDFTKPFDGSVSWKVSVEPAPADWPARVYHPGETPVWLYPRLPASSLLRTASGETEKYLFYRGVGRFELPVSAVFTDDGTVRVSNSGPDPVTPAMVYQLSGDGRVRWKTLPALAAGGSTVFNWEGQAFRPADEVRLDVHQAMAKMLMDSGLDRAEADAMILTWQASYFGTPGLRLFWVAPRPYVDRILPLQAKPAPSSVARVILGRLEMLSPAWERELVRLEKELEAKRQETPGPTQIPAGPHPYSYERHWPAYAKRLGQLLAQSPGAKR